MNFMDLMHAYFRGERLEALAFILPAGVLLIAFGVLLLRVDRSAFAWGVCVPAVIVGLVLAGTGLGVGLRTPAQVARLEAGFRADAVQQAREELPRMGTAATGGAASCSSAAV